MIFLPGAMKKKTLKTFRSSIIQRFKQGESVTLLIQESCSFIDDIILNAWQEQQLLTAANICLLAIGGYGRRELHLYSDIDLLILFSHADDHPQLSQAENFIRSLWDSGLEVGHSVRSIQVCTELAAQDATILTNLLDARLLCGDNVLFKQLKQNIQAENMWPDKAYFRAKWKEQCHRHKKYAQTIYNLEPNVKKSPGGLRDLQLINWLAKRYYSEKETGIIGQKPEKNELGLEEKFLIKQQLLTEEECDTFIRAKKFIWRIRFALHMFAKKHEDRLLFDYQIEIARLFSYEDNPKKLAIEQFMHDYFRAVHTLYNLNDLVLQSLRARIFLPEKQKITPLNARFQIRNRNIEVKDPQVFAQQPAALLEIFVLMAHHTNIRAVSADTVRLIYKHRHLIDENFRSKEKNRKLFMQLFRNNNNLAKQLKIMDRYGILALYLPEFGNVIGQMQYDLFHVYTVDQHTLFVIRNLNYFTQAQTSKQFPLCTLLMPGIKKHELLYIAALFHDIAKGRGGDHSELGARDVATFCQNHSLDPEDTALVVWLVENHLLLSFTAQRKDIYDPKTIQEFITQVEDKKKLDHLYLLTVADICATNPALWNSWKHSLLKELYHATNRALTTEPKNEEEIIQAKKIKASAMLKQQGWSAFQVDPLWHSFKDSYFLHVTSETIVKHTNAILQHRQNSKPLILTSLHDTKASTEIFIYMPDHKNRFAIATTILANHQLNILEAHIITAKNNFSLDSYIILDQRNKLIKNKRLLQQITTSLTKAFSEADKLPKLIPRRVSQQKQHFNIPIEIKFQEEKARQRTILLLISPDRPSLLAQISRAFVDCNIHLQTAKIATFGERVEDIFYITDADNQMITDPEKQQHLRQTICHYLTPVRDKRPV
ncbi:MAG: [protein-PII] uridylyltransferase [Gammaproteobacteria bacterium]